MWIIVVNLWLVRVQVRVQVRVCVSWSGREQQDHMEDIQERVRRRHDIRPKLRTYRAQQSVSLLTDSRDTKKNPASCIIAFGQNLQSTILQNQKPVVTQIP